VGPQPDRRTSPGRGSFLTGDPVYAFRKPVDLGFVRLATRAERDAESCGALDLRFMAFLVRARGPGARDTRA